MPPLNTTDYDDYITNITLNMSVERNDTIHGIPSRDPLPLVIPITIIYSLIFVTGLFGNVITCYVIIWNKSMHTATNYYLFSLAVSDLLLLICGMPQEIYFIWSKWPYIFGPIVCILRGLAAETSTNASVLTITLFTIERYLAICHPFASQKMSKLSRAIKHILILWVVSLGLALPQALEFGIITESGEKMCLPIRSIIKHSFEISLFFFFFAPMVLITVLYSLIALRLNRSYVNDDEENSSKKNSLNSSINTKKIHRKNSTQSTKRVIKMLVAVVVAFFVCWAPFHAQRLVAHYGTTENNNATKSFLSSLNVFLTYFSGVFYYLSTCINPIFYHVMSNKFRDAFKYSIKKCCCMKVKSPGIQQGSYTTVPMSRYGNRFEGSHRDRLRSTH